jgi:hypothetical protein
MGLNNLKIVNGFFSIGFVAGNSSLSDLTGLDNLTTIEMNFEIVSNENLINLNGAPNLTSIGGDLTIAFNFNLINITGLESVTSVGALWIYENPLITNLSGLDNIAPESISILSITYNPLLSNCQAQSICEYLLDPSGGLEINNNATGCNSVDQVESSCLVGIGEVNSEPGFKIFPNPATNEIYISSGNGSILDKINIYNQLGQKVLSKNQIINPIDVSELKSGIYMIELLSGNSTNRKKLFIN